MANSIRIQMGLGYWLSTESQAAEYDALIATPEGPLITSDMERLGITLPEVTTLLAQPQQIYKHTCTPTPQPGVEEVVYCDTPWGFGNYLSTDILGGVAFPSVLTIGGVREKINLWIVSQKLMDMASGAVRQNVPPDFSWIETLPEPEQTFARDQVRTSWRSLFIPRAVHDATPDKSGFQTPGGMFVLGVGAILGGYALAPLAAATIGVTVVPSAVVSLPLAIGARLAVAETTPDRFKPAPAAKARPTGAGASVGSRATLPTASPSAPVQRVAASVPMDAQAPSPVPLLAGGTLLLVGVAALLWPRKVLALVA